MKKAIIDFVLPWVDGNDPEWQKNFFYYTKESGDKRPERFRDMGTLRYWFRSVEKFAPWVNKVYFLTCGQLPDWLNRENPKLVCVRHDEYIPRKYLPTFSACTIELNLNRISELSEQFVLFNDDMFILRETHCEDFFHHDLPCDAAIMQYFIPKDYPLFLMPVVNAALLNRHFSKRDVILKYFSKFYSPKYDIKSVLKNVWFFPGTTIPGFRSFHLPNSFLKSTFDEIWSAEPELLDEVCRHRFRANTDINQWAVQGWQRCTGRFFPQMPPGKYFGISSLGEARTAAKSITASTHKLICLNDCGAKDFNQVKSELCCAFEHLLPQKSSFEQ